MTFSIPKRLSQRLAMPHWAGRRWMGPWPALALAAAILLVLLTSGAQVWVAGARAREKLSQDDLRNRLSEAERRSDSANANLPQSDFTQSLPKAISMDGFVQTLQRSAQAFNASMISVSSEPRNQTPTTLPKLNVSITLRGTYPALKSTLSEALSRYANAVVQQIAFKRDAALPGSEEMTIQLALPLRPTPSNAAM